MANDWEFSKSTGRCSATGRAFAEGESYYVVLFERRDGFERLDYSEESWTGPPAECFCFWRARVLVREKKPSVIAIDQEILLQLFLRLEDAESEMKQQFRFVLGLLLMRKRRLKFEQTLRDGEKEYWQMRLVREQSIHRVLNPHLTDAQVEALSEQLTAILAGNVQTLELMQQTDSDEESAEDRSDAEEHVERPAEAGISENESGNGSGASADGNDSGGAVDAVVQSEADSAGS